MHVHVDVDCDIRFSIVIDPRADDGISRRYRDGAYPDEFRNLLALLRATVKPGGRVLDLGGHIGSFTLAAAAAGYEVAAVEASPANVELLRESVRLNGFSRARIVHAAVSDRVGRMEFCSAGPFGHVSIPGDNGPSTTVDATTIEQLLIDLGWDRVDFIKIDVEGSELAALKGMGRHARGEDAPILFVESNGHTLDFFALKPFDLKKGLEDRGYRVFAATSDTLARVRPSDLQPETVIDLVALKSIPPALEGQIVEGGRSRDEIVTGVLASSRAANSAERAYIARALGDAPRALLRESTIREAAVALAADPEPDVSRAAARIGRQGRWPWLRLRATRDPACR